jgi:hypothetical protein
MHLIALCYDKIPRNRASVAECMLALRAYELSVGLFQEEKTITYISYGHSHLSSQFGRRSSSRGI